MGATDDIEFMARSEVRVNILEELSREDELTRAELRNRLDCSRTTVQRNLEALTEQGLVSNSNRTYSLNPGGRYFSDAFLDLVETTEVYDRLQPFLQRVEKSAFDIDLRHFSDAEIRTPESGDPYAMINYHVATIKEATTGFAILPFTGLHATEAAHNRVVEHGAQFELVVDRDVAETFQSAPQYAELIADLRETDRFQVFLYEGELPFGLGRLDDTVQLVASDGDEPKALVETTAEPVREWVRQTYDDYKADATRIL